ncbi:hypothetical protein [Saccharothrix algeriensis]|uniref:RNase H-like HicB family nuclease n=1 Tax=Saccharothrix algeriensis TaxID=173560 RepID=A0ABS2S2R3_9PSEU|nr:hypothetical protein [Saccharothrix algeriensis]MBM7810537.1 putative RNase H-like HicB family nuclease [Saccharothrix algeriensis]
MAESVVHVLLTDYGQFGWGISSPQLPELIGGRESYEELVADLDKLLAFGGATDGNPRLLHLQKHRVLMSGDEFLIRIARDSKFDARWTAGQQLTAALNIADQLTPLLSVPRRPTGEALFICAEPTDTVGWIVRQLDKNDAACVVISASSEMIRTQFFGTGSVEGDDSPWATLSELGWTEETTLSEIIRQQDSGKVSRGRLVAV